MLTAARMGDQQAGTECVKAVFTPSAPLAGQADEALPRSLR